MFLYFHHLLELQKVFFGTIANTLNKVSLNSIVYHLDWQQIWIFCLLFCYAQYLRETTTLWGFIGSTSLFFLRWFIFFLICNCSNILKCRSLISSGFITDYVLILFSDQLIFIVISIDLEILYLHCYFDKIRVSF